AVVGFRSQSDPQPAMYLLDIENRKQTAFPEIRQRTPKSCLRFKFLRDLPILVAEEQLDTTTPVIAWRVPEMTPFSFPEGISGVDDGQLGSDSLILHRASGYGYQMWNPESGEPPSTLRVPYFSGAFLGPDRRSFLGYDRGFICGLGLCSGDV